MVNDVAHNIKTG